MAAVELRMLPRQQRFQAHRECRFLDRGEALSRLTRLRQAHALHGHRGLRPQLQCDGPVNGEFACAMGANPIDRRALESLAIEAQGQPDRCADQEQQ